MYLRYNSSNNSTGFIIRKINYLYITYGIENNKEVYYIKERKEENIFDGIECILDTLLKFIHIPNMYYKDGYSLIQSSADYNFSEEIGTYISREDAEKELNNIYKAIEDGKKVYTVVTDYKF